MERKEVLERIKKYNQTISSIKCSALEKELMKMEDGRYSYCFNLDIRNFTNRKWTGGSLENVEVFLEENHYFSCLLKENHEKLCFYLRQMQMFTCNRNIIRMDARSKNFEYYLIRATNAIRSFYVFYGLGLDLKKAVYGQYRQFPMDVDFAPIIATEIMHGNQEVITYCNDVLMSENNTAVLTRDVIVAIEQADNAELHKLLLDVFVAARLQEGLRQSIIETIDENRIEPFLLTLDVIQEQGLLRFSSVQRGILTWIGIGYEIVEEKQVRLIFDWIYEYLHDKEKHMAAFESENPLQVYLALYCIGIYDVDEAMEKAVELLEHSKRHIVAAALIYLKMTNHFPIIKYMHFAESEDEWIRALYFSECIWHSEMQYLEPQQAELLYSHVWNFLQEMNPKKKYVCKGFEWFSDEGLTKNYRRLSKDTMIETLFCLLERIHTQEMVDKFLPYVSTYSYYSNRVKIFMEQYYPVASEDKKRAFLLKEIISANEILSEYVTKEYLKLELSEKEIIQLESRLKSKKGYARANIIKVLANQNKEQVVNSYKRLIVSKTKTIYESALELRQVASSYFEGEEMERLEGYINAQGNLQSVESHISAEINVQISNNHACDVMLASTNNSIPKVTVKGKAEGFSLYERKKCYHIPYTSHLNKTTKGLFLKKENVDLSFLQVMSLEKVVAYIHLWEKRIAKHALEEYKTYGDYYRQVGQSPLYDIGTDKTLDGVPLGDVWRKYFEEDNLSPDEVFFLRYLNGTMGRNFHDGYFHLPKEIELCSMNSSILGKLDYFSHYATILEHYFLEIDHSSFPEKACQFLELINTYAKKNSYTVRNKNYLGEVYETTYSCGCLRIFSFMIKQLNLMEVSDEAFREYFPVLYESYEKFHLACDETTQDKLDIPLRIVARAVTLELLPKEALYEMILDGHTEEQSYYSSQTTTKHRLVEAYDGAYYHSRGTYGNPNFSMGEEQQDMYRCLREALDKIADTLLAMEATRFNEVTEVTQYIRKLRVIRGVKSLIFALHVLDGEEIKRQTYGNDKNEVFTEVLRHCYPLESDSAEQLRQEGFSEKRLVEVAMLAPQWIPMIGEVLGWNGFKDACYYFIAHMKQYGNDEKKAEIAQYTDIEPIDLNDGAFDMDWCKGVYEVLGEKRFSLIYQAAKFLCENSFHTRARKYADACLGKKEKEVFLEQAKEKRNKDALNAYCICPLADDKDLLERYLYVQQFLKETKAFGSQRQASEKRACEIALMNLARNSRFQTVTRLSWVMETEVVQQYRSFLEPKQIEDVEVWIAIDAFGQNEICVRKNGKMLKSIPAKLKKHEKILEIKEVHTLFSNQYKRSKQMLQTAMEERIMFGKEEMDAISKNPIVAPMLQTLVLKNEGHFGFYKDGMLCGLKETYEVGGDIYIAHPYDLHKANVWDDYRKYVFDHQLVQPFKQIFRELYLKLEDELVSSLTKRYSGYQIQPKKAAAALKGRRWNVSYENGLERVYHKENLVVHLYADADWFSPSDIEAPSIDYVAFYECKNNAGKKIEEIDDVIYSEIMRDVDLAVSTAYVGGVDPITSFSTIELRRAIIEYTCQLMKLENVTVQENFANIQGKHNNYHVHLGSGMIHQDGGSSIHMVPVFSGKRGKVYLPFLDEDPMSAQILTKVLMLTEDTKIKDPAILSQIVTKK